MGVDIAALREKLRNWFLSDALPLWSVAGTDFVSGGFFEFLDDNGNPVEAPRRARLVARQIYVFATARRFGWTGPASQRVRHGVSYLRRYMIRDGDTVIPTVRSDGKPERTDFDLYDTAFVLFGLAAAAQCLREGEPVALAGRIREHLETVYAHPVAGFEESVPPSVPLKANPHMHLFEAAMAWEQVAPDPAPWRAMADGIAELCLSRFIDPKSGALREFFELDWRPAQGEPGRLVEPGHQFEWSWLLMRWAARRGCERPIEAALKLAQNGERFGVDPARGIAINELHDDFSPRDANARLWPQTERIKAWNLIARSFPDRAKAMDAERHLAAALAGLMRYFEGKPAGLFWDVMRPDGRFVSEPTRASSLYHIACALEALDDKIG